MSPRLVSLAIILSAMLATAGPLYATTWNEPWMDSVIVGAENLVLARVLSNDESKGAVIRVVRTIAGAPVEGEIRVNDFYALDLCSISGGHGPEFIFDRADSCYFFLKKNDSGGYSVATPTTGYAVVQQGNVIATYRHSYHQAVIPMEMYEGTMKPIFDRYHGIPHDPTYVENLIGRVLTLAPAKIKETERTTFFAQHAALESIYHLGLRGHYAKILPFLHDSVAYHSRISAVRALRAYDSDEAGRELMAVIADTSSGDFLQVMAVESLGAFERPDLKKELQKIEATASTRNNGFGGNIMDPRVCTGLPSVKQALQQLIARW